MKLRNKKTGFVTNWYIDKDIFITCDGSIKYNSLVELNEDWEDYEEPKYIWYINWKGDVQCSAIDNEWECEKSIGNYFETKEEAEKAVEKLKAWKRLKDKGFRFTGINDEEASQLLISECGILCKVDIGYHLSKDEDFILLFGGEE